MATVTLSAVTYAFARSSLLDQRTERRQSLAVSNARKVLDQLRPADSPTDQWFQDIVRTESGGFAAAVLGGDERSRTDTRLRRAFPSALAGAVAIGRSGIQRFSLGGQLLRRHRHRTSPRSTPTTSRRSRSHPTERTLRTILLALTIGSLITVLLARRVGVVDQSAACCARCGRITDAAGEIAAGDLDTRVARESDPDLDLLADSFNNMADAVQARIEREARFASDVSHELRSPITALAAAAEVLDGRRDELPERTQQALDVVVGQVRRFDAMVIDLLELSRIDAGATDLHTEDGRHRGAVPRIAAALRLRRPPDRRHRRRPTDAASRSTGCASSASSPTCCENAEHHGGGPMRIDHRDDGPGRSTSPSRTPVPGSHESERGTSSSASPVGPAPPAPGRHRARPRARRRARHLLGGRGVGRGPPGWRGPLRRPSARADLDRPRRHRDAS